MSEMPLSLKINEATLISVHRSAVLRSHLLATLPTLALITTVDGQCLFQVISQTNVINDIALLLALCHPIHFVEQFCSAANCGA